MSLFDILFPIVKAFEDLQTDDLDVISQNNWRLANELKDKPAMSAQEIKKYVEKKETPKD